jgi:exonuclease VII small subunit
MIAIKNIRESLRKCPDEEIMWHIQEIAYHLEQTSLALDEAIRHLKRSKYFEQELKCIKQRGDL